MKRTKDKIEYSRQITFRIACSDYEALIAKFGAYAKVSGILRDLIKLAVTNKIDLDSMKRVA